MTKINKFLDIGATCVNMFMIAIIIFCITTKVTVAIIAFSLAAICWCCCMFISSPKQVGYEQSGIIVIGTFTVFTFSFITIVITAASLL